MLVKEAGGAVSAVAAALVYDVTVLVYDGASEGRPLSMTQLMGYETHSMMLLEPEAITCVTGAAINEE